MENADAYDDDLDLESMDKETLKKEILEMLELLSPVDAHWMLDSVTELIQSREGDVAFALQTSHELNN